MSAGLVLTFVILSLQVVLALGKGSSLQVWLTNGDKSKLLSAEPPIPAGASADGKQISIDTSKQNQTIEGFGAAITDASSYNIYNSPNRESIVQELFSSSKTGIGLNVIRLPMGGTDLSVDQPYTYDDMQNGQTDFKLLYFSIEKDKRRIIPTIKLALTFNPNLKVMATPWSAPAWMKTSGSLNGGSLINNDQYLQVYAEYFVRFIQAYAKEGITIDFLTVQNEPLNESNYPTMRMDSWQQARFVKQFLGPAFINNEIDTKIIIYDHNWDNITYPLSILNDAEARKFVTGSAWHCYAGDKNSPSQVKAAYPDKDIFFTECSGGAWNTDFTQNLGWNAQTLFIGQLRVWSRTVLLWNMALDENHGPRFSGLGGCANCRGVVTVKQDKFDKNVEFYSLGHFAKFVNRGAVVVDSSHFPSENLETIAFRNPDNSIVVVVLNTSWNDSKDFYIQIETEKYQYRGLQKRSIVTFVRN